MFTDLIRVKDCLTRQRGSRRRIDRHKERAQDQEALTLSRADEGDVLAQLGTSLSGLSMAEAETRLKTYGPNAVGNAGAPAGVIRSRPLPTATIVAGIDSS
jgi:hypothetical protein